MNLKNDNEQILSLTERFAKHARDFDDLQNEMAGRDTGRMKRFLPDGANSADPNGKAKQQRADALTHLQLLMMDNPAYAALFEETAQVLTDAQRRLDDLLQRVQTEIERANAILADKLDGAARLPDGTRVFKDQKGDIRAEDGAMVAAELAVTILWRGDEPTLEEINADKERLNRLNDLANDVRSGQTEIGDMQAAMADETDPPSADDLSGYKKRADEIVEGTEQRFEAEIAEPVADIKASSHAPNGITNLAFPER